jgi:hypothetical protein
MKADDLIDLVAPDHEIELVRKQLPDGDKYILSCSCGFTAARMVHPREVTAGYDGQLTGAWSDSEILGHLLEQEVDVKDILLKIEQGELT